MAMAFARDALAHIANHCVSTIDTVQWAAYTASSLINVLLRLRLPPASFGELRMLLARLRLSSQLLLLTVGTAALAVILLVSMAVYLTGEVVQGVSDQRLTALSEATGELITAPLAAQNVADIERILATVVRDEGLDRAAVLAPDGTT